MAGWEDLAVELIMKIVSQVDQWRLKSLSLTSKQLHMISQHFMYRSVNLSRDWESVRIIRFLRSLAMQPQLGERVRHLKMSGGEEGPIWTVDDSLFATISGPDNSKIRTLKWTELPDPDVSFLTEISQRVGIPEHLYFGQKTSHTALIASVLHHVPRLQTLYFDGVEDLGLIPTMIALGMVPGGVPAALNSIVEIQMRSRLHNVIDLERENTLGWLPWQSVIPFIMLPSMKRCRFEEIAMDGREEMQLTQQVDRRLISLIIPNTSTIEGLYLITCNIPADGLQTLLSLSSGLREFSYIPKNAAGVLLAWHNNNYPPLASRLRVHAETLTSLRIHNVVNWGKPVTGGVLGSLTEFTTLRHLYLDIMALYSPMNPMPEIPTPLQNLLPASLITLDLWLEPPCTLPSFIASTGCPDNWVTADDLLPSLEMFTLHLDISIATENEYHNSAGRFKIAGIALDRQALDDWIDYMDSGNPGIN